jgi:hypothetical protein
MAPPQTQTLATHVHRPVLTAWAGALALIALGFFIAELIRHPSALIVGLLFLSFSVLVLVSISRVYIVKLQDRIIFTEMRLRLARLGREADYARLTPRQLVALRFASDRELPALIDRTLTENLTSKQIKDAVREWQGDYHRT